MLGIAHPAFREALERKAREAGTDFVGEAGWTRRVTYIL
jgi:hypothetical protein